MRTASRGSPAGYAHGACTAMRCGPHGGAMVPATSILTRVAAYPRMLALGLGLLSATGFQPMGVWPLALAAMGGLFSLLARTDNWREAARLGWLFGLAHFTLGNAWIATAFTYQAEMPAILGWFVVPLLALYLAVYPALAALAARLASKNNSGWPPAF